jgi:hypothetical protein
MGTQEFATGLPAYNQAQLDAAAKAGLSNYPVKKQFINGCNFAKGSTFLSIVGKGYLYTVGFVIGSSPSGGDAVIQVKVDNVLIHNIGVVATGQCFGMFQRDTVKDEGGQLVGESPTTLSTGLNQFYYKIYSIGELRTDAHPNAVLLTCPIFFENKLELIVDPASGSNPGWGYVVYGTM